MYVHDSVESIDQIIDEYEDKFEEVDRPRYRLLVQDYMTSFEQDYDVLNFIPETSRRKYKTSLNHILDVMRVYAYMVGDVEIKANGKSRTIEYSEDLILLCPKNRGLNNKLSYDEELSRLSKRIHSRAQKGYLSFKDAFNWIAGRDEMIGKFEERVNYDMTLERPPVKDV